MLKQNGEITVPGLGFLVQARMSAYYDEAKGKFFPPYHQVQFDPQVIEDDTLPQYIADRKNISLASAKYFTEKYISDLKQEALVKEVPMADLGWFYMNQATMAFRPNTEVADNVALFGFAPVEIRKQRRKPLGKPKTPAVVVTEEIPNITFTSKVVEEEAGDERFPSVLQLDKVHEQQVKRRYAILYTIITLVLVLGLTFLAIYQFAPATFQKFVALERRLTGQQSDDQQLQPIVKLSVKQVSPAKANTDSAKISAMAVKADSIAKADSVAKADSAAKVNKTSAAAKKQTTQAVAPNQPQLIKRPVVTGNESNPTSVAHPLVVKKEVIKPTKQDSARLKRRLAGNTSESGNSRYELIIGSSESQTGLDAAITRLREVGVSATPSINMSGSKYYISEGVYETKADAVAKMQKLLKQNKISNSSFINEIK